MHHLGTAKSRAALAVAAVVIGGGGLMAGSAALVLAGTGPVAAAQSPAMPTGMTGTATGPATAGAQMYTCAAPPNAATGGTATMSTVPMQLAASGPDTMAANDEVSLTSAAPGEPMAGATPMAASASVGLEGASGGSIPLSVGMDQGHLELTAQWQPARPGVYHLVAPRQFQVTMRTTTKVTVVVVCTTTAVTTISTTVHVTSFVTPSPNTAGFSASETPTTPAASAPATGAGGSLHSPVDVALLIAGLVAVTAGAVTMLLAIRRRGRALMP